MAKITPVLLRICTKDDCPFDTQPRTIEEVIDEIRDVAHRSFGSMMWLDQLADEQVKGLLWWTQWLLAEAKKRGIE